MLSILTNDGFLPLQHKVNNFYVDLQYGGFHSLSFDISIKSDLYPLLIEESVLQYSGNSWVIKKINERSGSALSTIIAELDLRDWKGQHFDHFATETQSLSYVLEYIKPANWSIVNAGLVARRLNINLEHVTGYDLLQKCAEYYDVLYEFDTISKTVTVIKPIDVGQDRGLYLSRELNLTSLDLKGTSENLITRLIPLGKRNDETGSYLDITPVNDNRNYVDNRDYLDKTIVGWWIDERYTDPQSLKDAAIEKLKVLSVPTRAYTCTVMDLAKVKPEKYGFLNFELYDSLVLLDDLHKVRLVHQIIKYREYPDEPNRNVITLSTVPQQIKSQIKVITGKIDESLTYTRNIKNEILRSVDTNYAKISETYTKGQTETLIQSEITQSQDLIRTEVSQTFLTKNDGQTAISGLQSTIEQQANQIELTVKSIGMPNLIVNSAFKNGTENWNEIPTGGGSIEFIPEAVGGPCFKLTATADGGKAELSQDLTIGRRMGRVHLSAEVMVEGDTAQWCGIGFYFTYEDGTNYFPISSTDILNLPRGQWSRVKVAFTPNSQKTVKKISPLAYVKSGNATLYVRKMYAYETAEVISADIWNDLSTADVISQINMSPEGIKIQGKHLDLQGFVTFTDLTTSGKTTISGGTIKSCTIEGGKYIMGTDPDKKVTIEQSQRGMMFTGQGAIDITCKDFLFWPDNNIWVDGYKCFTEDITLVNWDGNLIKFYFKKGLAQGYTTSVEYDPNSTSLANQTYLYDGNGNQIKDGNGRAVIAWRGLLHH